MIHHHELPVNNYIVSSHDPIAWIFSDFEYAQPPLFYVVNIPFALLPDPMLGSRLFAVFLSTITLWLLIQSALELFRRNETAAVLMTALAGFNPVFLRIGSSVSNDNLAWLLSLILFRLFLHDRESRRKWLFGLLIGLGILTKASFFIWIIFTFARIFVIRLKESREGSWKKRLHGLLLLSVNPSLIALTALAMCCWWLIRNQALYGDWSAIAGNAGFPGEYVISGSLDILDYFIRSAVRFTFFPVAEESVSFMLPVHAFVLIVLTGFLIQGQNLRLEFEDSTVFTDFVLFTALNLVLFLFANLRWSFSETRHLAIGLLPLLGLVCAVLLRTLGNFSIPAAILVNASYAFVLW